MNSGPWWATPAFTLGGVLMTLHVTVWLDRRKARRESAFRWTERKMGLYSDYLIACNELLAVEVWPRDRNQPARAATTLLDKIRRIAAEIAFVAPASVSECIDRTATTAAALAANIDHIRATSRPGHHGGIDERLQQGHNDAREDFATTIDGFLAAARMDVDIRTPLREPGIG